MFPHLTTEVMKVALHCGIFELACTTVIGRISRSILAVYEPSYALKHDAQYCTATDQPECVPNGDECSIP